jgi:Fe-S oxidoreductase
LALRIIIGLGLTAVAAVIAGRRMWWLYRLGRTGQPAPERIAALREHPARQAETQATEVLGQRKLLQWSVPGAAHALVFWGFIVLLLTIIEAYGDLFSKKFAIIGIGTWAWVGFIEDLFAVAVLAGIITFAVIRLAQDPRREGRGSRFSGSHTGAAWLVLLMIFGVIVTLLVYRGAQVNTGDFPYPRGAFASQLVGHWLHPLGHGANSGIETAFILAQLAVVLGFGAFLTYSKHLHIVVAPVNVLLSRRPNALGALPPMRSNGKPLDFEEADPDTDVFGLGKIEDLSWKGMLDLATCTECGRCQSQCPAWATGKPLSPKMVILDLRDHAFAKAPYLLAGSDEARERLPAQVQKEAERPLVGNSDVNGVIDPDVIWSCTNCGACVEECPVDIEHIDHIAGMRRHQVLIESAFPAEASAMLKNLENKGDPWGMGAARRLDWAEGLGFEVPVADGPLGDDVEYLFWVGCAGALEDRARKTTRAIAQLLHTAGVSFAVLGPAETCTGDPARRMGNEFVFTMLAQQNVETLNEARVRKVVASCPHCFNTFAHEYPQLGGNYEVIHHTQLLARLVDEGRLTPVNPIEEKITYHDPCFLGRHNRVFTAPRQIMEQVPGVRAQEMHRCKERGFCCGAGGARMWMEERIGKRINAERIEEALGTDPDTISTGCPFCLVMLGDAVSAKQGSGEAKESLEVVDVAQLLVRSVAPGDDREPGQA